MDSRVAISRCGHYSFETVFEAVRRSVDLLGGMRAFVKKGERILVKPNLLAAKPAEAAVTTHPMVVKAVLRLVKEAGATPFVADSPGIGSALKIAEKCGVLDVCREEGVELTELKTLILVENPLGHTFKRLEVADEALKADGIINLPKLKTHAQMHLTMGVKNLFGCVPGKTKPQWHLSAGVDSRDFAGMLLDLYFFLGPRLTIMDAVVGMEGNGPGSGDPRKLGLIMAAVDCIAMDTAACDLLGGRTHDVPILKAALKRGLKQAETCNVTAVGAVLDEVRVDGFRFPPRSSVNFAERLPYFIDKRLRKALTSRPHVDDKACTMCSVCVNVCPAGIMTGKKRIEIDYDRCIRCYCCQEMCPQGAITPRQGWLKKIIPGM